MERGPDQELGSYGGMWDCEGRVREAPRGNGSCVHPGVGEGAAGPEPVIGGGAPVCDPELFKYFGTCLKPANIGTEKALAKEVVSSKFEHKLQTFQNRTPAKGGRLLINHLIIQKRQQVWVALDDPVDIMAEKYCGCEKAPARFGDEVGGENEGGHGRDRTSSVMRRSGARRH